MRVCNTLITFKFVLLQGTAEQLQKVYHKGYKEERREKKTDGAAFDEPGVKELTRAAVAFNLSGWMKK